MVFTSYNAFRVSVQWLIEGDELTGTFSVNTLDLIIGLAEARCYRDLRTTTMMKTASATVTANAAPLPADLLELSEVYFSGKRPLDIIPLERLRTYEAAGTGTAGGVTRFCAQDGDTLRFWPTATTATSATLGYYAKPAALATVTWANATTFARYPEVFVYATLVEAMPFLGMDAKTQLWEAKYQKALSDAIQDEQLRVYGGGPLRMRSR